MDSRVGEYMSVIFERNPICFVGNSDVVEKIAELFFHWMIQVNVLDENLVI